MNIYIVLKLNTYSFVANNIVMHNSEGYTADPCNAISLANFEDSFDLQYNVH